MSSCSASIYCSFFLPHSLSVLTLSLHSTATPLISTELQHKQVLGGTTLIWGEHRPLDPESGSIGCGQQLCIPVCLTLGRLDLLYEIQLHHRWNRVNTEGKPEDPILFPALVLLPTSLSCELLAFKTPLNVSPSSFIPSTMLPQI